MVTYLGSLVQLCCGEGGTLQTNITSVGALLAVYGPLTSVGGLLAVYGPHWVCPSSWHMCFTGLQCSGSRLLCRGTVQSGSGFRELPRFLNTSQDTDSVGPGFCALPRSKQLRRPGAWQAHCPRWSICLNHLASHSRLVPWVHCKSTVSGVPCISSGELIPRCNPPGRCQPSRISGRLG